MVITSPVSKMRSYNFHYRGNPHPKWLAWTSSQKKEVYCFSCWFKICNIDCFHLGTLTFPPHCHSQRKYGFLSQCSNPKFCGFCCLLTRSCHLNFNNIYSLGKINNKISPLAAHTFTSFTQLLKQGFVHGKQGISPKLTEDIRTAWVVLPTPGSPEPW